MIYELADEIEANRRNVLESSFLCAYIHAAVCVEDVFTGAGRGR